MPNKTPSLYQLYAILLPLTLALQTLIVMTSSHHLLQMTNSFPITFGPLLLLMRSDVDLLSIIIMTSIPLSLLTTPLLPDRFLRPSPPFARILSATTGAFAWYFTGMLIHGIDC